MSDLKDIENWIIRIGLGDRKAFNALYDATSAKLFGVCLRVLHKRSDAEEALQEAYIRIWQRARNYQANGYSPMTWLITLTRNIAIDQLRARKAPTEDITSRSDIIDEGLSPEREMLATSQRQQIDRCLEELEDVKAGAVRGAYLFGYSYEELAAQYEVPLNTMRTWLRRSLLKLRECLTR